MRLRLAALLACGIVVYANAMPAPFFLDDQTSVLANPTIRQLWPLSIPLRPPADTPVARRPLVNLTFAANFAYGGLDPRGYRVVNLAIHLLVALVLFGLVRRTLDLDRGAEPQGSRGEPGLVSRTEAVAWFAAVLWLLHPLNSEVVDYVTQRSESLMALAYLSTLYCAIRAYREPESVSETTRRGARRRAQPSQAPPHDTRWTIAAVACCAAGVLCKESIVTAPVAVALYDRVFLFDSFAAAVRRRWRLYAGLAASWLLLTLMIWSAARTTAGFESGISPTTYLLNQVRLIPHYLYLVVWPRALVVDYGPTQALTFHDVLVPAIALAAIVIAGVVLFVRAPRLGFGMAWLFLTIAPTSSFVPIVTEVGAERRMYLPLAGLLAMAVVAAALLLRRVPRRAQVSIAIVVCVLAAIGTYMRNREYRDLVTLSRTVVERWPSGRGHFFYGTQLIEAGQRDAGIEQFRLSAATYPGGHYALGSELVDAGRVDEGLAELREFIRLAPRDQAVSPARDLIGRVLVTRGQLDAAAQEFSLILEREPRNVRALVFLGDVRYRQGRSADAIAAYQRARSVDPSVGGDATVLGRLAASLASVQRLTDAIAAAQDAVAMQPDNPELQKMLGQTLALGGRIGDAVPHFRRAVELAPDDGQARAFLQAAQQQSGRR